MHLKFPFIIILILTKLNRFVVLHENRIRIILQAVFKIIFCLFVCFWLFPFFMAHLFLFALPVSFFSHFSLVHYLMVLNTFCCFLKD